MMPALYVLPVNRDPFLLQFHNMTPRATLTLLQELVNCHIEHIKLPKSWFHESEIRNHQEVHLIVNEEGLLHELKSNKHLLRFVGNIFIAIMDPENEEQEFVDFDERLASQILKIIQKNS